MREYIELQLSTHMSKSRSDHACCHVFNLFAYYLHVCMFACLHNLSAYTKYHMDVMRLMFSRCFERNFP